MGFGVCQGLECCRFRPILQDVQHRHNGQGKRSRRGEDRASACQVLNKSRGDVPESRCML